MSLFTHIIASWQDGYWSAWFESAPDVICHEPTALDAIYELMQIHSLPDLSMVQCVTVDDGTIIGRTEIRASDSDWQQYPFPTSVN